MDFTLKKYKSFLDALISRQYNFQTFEEFILNPKSTSIILRHDVDLLPENSLEFAKIQEKQNIKGTYYFRAKKESWNENIIKKISTLGHEVGYHYECLATCKGNLEKAIIDFEKNLTKLRKLAQVSTICMHGSPLSKDDSRDLWKKYSYKEFGIIGEPYFDVDFNSVLYLTDTGRRWDGKNYSVRDKVNSSLPYSFHKTDEIISASNNNKLPNQIMFTFHPQRWTENKLLWTKELFNQNLKNIIKRFL
jgi:hypothetical protein